MRAGPRGTIAGLMQRRVLVVTLLAACGGGSSSDPDATPPDATVDAAVAPVFRNPVDLPDDQLALQALQLLGAEVDGADRNCDICHGLSRSRLEWWGELSGATMSGCLTNLTVTSPDEALSMIACLRANPTDATSEFAPYRTGVYSIAAHLDWFDYLFHLGYPETGDQEYQAFLERVQMPRGTHAPFDQGQFDIIAEWLARGMPLLADLVPDNNTGSCTPSITQAVSDHVDALATTGWHVVNAENGIDMLGCAGAATTRECLASFPSSEETTYGAAWADDLPGSVLRVLHQINYMSAYWTRSSADGRYVAFGDQGGPQGGSTIIDLQDDRLIGTAALYDPGFFPDNSGFAFQGNGARFCNQSMLATDTYVSYQEADCITTSAVALYQHLGAALGGGDYWTVAGQFENDSGGHQDGPSYDPGAGFGSTARARLVPMIHNGSTYEVGTLIEKSTPGEGDTVISPSARLLISRVAGAGGAQNGYIMRRVDATPSGDTYTIEIPEIARYCIQGGKPAFSFDERWMVLHHYVTGDDAVDLGFTGSSDPAFAPYLQQGAANIYLVDLKTGDRIRITKMGPGQFALFPHFRSDGWIYFNVRTGGQNLEYFVASDAALLVGGQ